MLVGDFMIDDTNYADCLTLYNFNHVDKIKGKESFSYIFNDNINYIRSLYNRGKIRNITYDTIQKTILCGSIYLGYDLFVCPHCGNESIVPHKCHSKLCTSCGTKEAKLRAAHISSIALDAKHRHIVFTIPDLLRGYFIKDRSLLNLLFIAARNTLACIFNDAKYRKIKKKKIYLKKNKCPYSYKNDRNKIVFGSVLTLHTFGRDLKWNPHIHCLVCEEAFDTKKNKMKNFSFISYEKLRKTWMYQVLDLLSKQKLKHFRYLKQRFYDELVNGFYVYAKKKEKDNDDNNVDDCVNYITRYTSRPPIAENFINNLILHCPDENFKMVRYYGFYSNRNKKLLEKIYELYGIKKKKRIRNLKEKKDLKNKLDHLKYRTHMIESFQKNILLCSCGNLMKCEHT